MANNKCMECGCECKKCVSENDVHLHVEIENLKQRLVERDNHIVTMETNFLNEANKFPSGEVMALREELLTWQDKYKRLYEAHRRVQRVNQGLEDKLLKLVDVCETEKNTLTKDVATLSHKLADAKYTIKKLTEDNERYKSDVALAIQFLQCKQSNFVSQKIDTLPPEVQSQVSSYLNNGKKKQLDEIKKTVPEVKSIKVPIPTFPPTAMVYSVPKSPNASIKNGDDSCTTTENDNHQAVDIVSAAIMAKVLEERERERSMIKHCDSCTCANKTIRIVSENSHHSVAVQTSENGCDDNSASSSLINLSEISHHRLCDKSSPTYEISAKNTNNTSSSAKGPRYCSMRLQSGSKNILLDNAHSNVAPVLYTRQHQNTNQKPRKDAAVRAHANSCCSDESLHNQQRIADWVENSNEFEVSSPENSKSESLRNNNEQKLATMEDNVKKFLFGKSEFLKTVEIGKMKYQNLRDGATVHNQNFTKTSRSNSHTETEI